MSLKHYFWLPDKKPLVGRAWLGRGLTLLVVLSIVNIDSSAAAAGLDKEEKATLDTIERKYFDHTYGKEETETRLERLEKLVFGESKTGDEEARLKTLTAAVPAALSEPEPKAIAPPIGSGSNQDSQATDTTDGDDDTSTDYPRVDALEQIIMGKSYKGEHLKRRLEQLEIKVFGKARSNADFSERVDHLEGYAEKHYHKSISQLTDPRNLYNYNFPAQGSQSSAYRPPAYSGSGSYGMQPPVSMGQPRYESAPQAGGTNSPPSPATPIPDQVTWLENQVYGHSYPQMPLVERLKKLETSVFPSEPPDTTASIPMQVKVLINAVALMHPSNRPSGSPEQSNDGNFPSWPPQGTGSNFQAAYPGYAQTSSRQGAGGYEQNDQSTAYTGTPGTYQQAPQQQQEQQQKHGHPFLKSLARSLVTVGSMAAGAALGGYGSGYGAGGYGGYGSSGVGRPGYW